MKKIENALFIVRRQLLNRKIFYIIEEDSEHLFGEVMRGTDRAEVKGTITAIGIDPPPK